jgi:hypothetical protein
MFSITYSDGITSFVRGPFESYEEAYELFMSASIPEGSSACLDDMEMGDALHIRHYEDALEYEIVRTDGVEFGPWQYDEALRTFRRMHIPDGESAYLRNRHTGDMLYERHSGDRSPFPELKI